MRSGLNVFKQHTQGILHTFGGGVHVDESFQRRFVIRSVFVFPAAQLCGVHVHFRHGRAGFELFAQRTVRLTTTVCPFD